MTKMGMCFDEGNCDPEYLDTRQQLSTSAIGLVDNGGTNAYSSQRPIKLERLIQFNNLVVRQRLCACFWQSSSTSAKLSLLDIYGINDEPGYLDKPLVITFIDRSEK